MKHTPQSSRFTGGHQIGADGLGFARDSVGPDRAVREPSGPAHDPAVDSLHAEGKPGDGPVANGWNEIENCGSQPRLVGRS